MQKIKNQEKENYLEKHDEIEERETKIEIKELSQVVCKLCGEAEYKYNLCEKCSSEHKSESIKNIGFLSGCALGSILAVFISSGSFILTFGLSIGVITQQTISLFRR